MRKGIVKSKVERRPAVRSLCIDSFQEAASPTKYHGLAHVLFRKEQETVQSSSVRMLPAWKFG